MSAPALDDQIASELKRLLADGLASGKLTTRNQMEEYFATFRDRFGPDVLRDLDGEALLHRIHGRREQDDGKCLAYWLEFKNDDEFAGYTFGSIAGGSALKFGLYQRQADGAWITGSPTKPEVLSLSDAVARVTRQRDELLAGDKVLAATYPYDTSDAAYARLQLAMQAAAPDLHQDGWAHKYWFLLHPDRLDDYHSPRYQRFHLFKLLQMPPDRTGILDWQTPRFNCAGRFSAAALVLGVPITTLNTVLNQRHGTLHRYWRVGTTSGQTGESHWDVMREGGFVSIGWVDQVPDLRDVLVQDRPTARAQIREWLLADKAVASAGVATRKAGEILNFTQEIAENDLVLACDGQTVLGVGRVRGAYEYDKSLAFPHKRPVEWLLLEQWFMPEGEGLRTTVVELGKNAANLLDLEQRLFQGRLNHTGSVAKIALIDRSPPLPTLDLIISRIEQILHRKGQVLLYGPPGTGKTYGALRAARELAARRAFHKTFEGLTAAERAEAEDVGGLVRVCTFHPGYGYEDFIEGLRPRTNGSGQMVFEPRAGIFKRLCTDAAQRPDRDFFLVVDEFNRGDVPRIFGELLTVVERDKRGMVVVLPVTGEAFSVPPNVFLIGTMNTADRSISLLDAALRRRFGFIELMPDSSRLLGRKVGDLRLGPWLDALNARLRRHLKRDARNLQVGHAYLMPRQPISSTAEFARILRDDLVPLLEEYCYDDFATLKHILGDLLVDAEGGRIRTELFEPAQEDKLLQALRFPEMEPFEIAEAAAGTELDGDGSEPGTEDPLEKGGDATV